MNFTREVLSSEEYSEYLLQELKQSIFTIQRDLILLKDQHNATLISDSPSFSPTSFPSNSSFDSFTEFSAFNSGDTAWMLISTILVVGMTIPGVMLYYAGMVRLQNALSTAMQGFGLACVITFLWLCFGYSLSFAPINGDSHHHENNTPIFGDASRFWLQGVMTLGTSHQLAPTIPESIFCCYQLTFAIITPCLICGAFADRMKYTAVLLALGLWHLVVYCPMAHLNWHPNGFLYRVGVLDFAGGNVVHISAGASALVASLIVGKRTSKNSFPPHNLLLTLIGSCSLIMGWFGFNAGSAFQANQIAGFAMINSQIAASLASLSWMMCDIIRTGNPTLEGVMNGTIAGLVAITPAAGFVTPSSAFVIGIASGIACFFGIKIKTLFQFDDSLDAFGIHATAGVIGGLLTGLLAHTSDDEEGSFHGNSKQFGIQLFGIVLTLLWSVVGTALVFFLVEALVGLRVSKESEVVGLDAVLHGNTMTSQASKAVKKEKDDEKYICCRLYFPCCIFTLRHSNPNSPTSSPNSIMNE